MTSRASIAHAAIIGAEPPLVRPAFGRHDTDEDEREDETMDANCRRECDVAIEEMLATDRAIRYTFAGHLTRDEANRGLTRSHERCDRRIAEIGARQPSR